jgi:hypothetical protein
MFHHDLPFDGDLAMSNVNNVLSFAAQRRPRDLSATNTSTD